MQVEQHTWSVEHGWSGARRLPGAQLVLVFGHRSDLASDAWQSTAGKRWPAGIVVGCSTAGQIAGTAVFDAGAVATAIHFDHTELALATVRTSASDSAEAGKRIAAELNRPGLVHVLVFSEGLDINGDALVRGLSEGLPSHVTVTGGLSADGEAFRETIVLAGDQVCTHAVVGVGLYGDRLKVGYGSLGGWDSFGPERMVTRSEGNVLYELDGLSALGLYKRYLGGHAADLPASGLLFPLSLRMHERAAAVVRTILSVNESDQSMTFAGDVPEGGYVRLMKANFDRLIDGAVGAGRVSTQALADAPAELALLISCVGRRMVLRQRVEEEVEGVREVVGLEAVLTGFYSYGEISPFTPSARCELHNQTMTVTTLTERS
jgi:hypothetical protein